LQIRLRNVLAWTLSIFLSFAFIAQFGLPHLVTQSASFWGIAAPGWAVRLIGVVEVAAGFLVLLPSLRLLGAALVAVLMIGVLGAEFVTGAGAASTAGFMLALAGMLIALRPPTSSR